jgi:hypothetical protein
MFRKNFVNLLAIMIVVICGCFGLKTAKAINPVLSISFGANRNNVEPGFTRFLVTDSGSIINGIQIDLELMMPPVAGTWVPAWNARDRGGAIPTTVQWYLLYRQLIFARPGGIRITLTGLEKSTPYELEIWDYDSGSASPRIADVNVNDEYCMTIQCNNSSPPSTGLENYYTGTCTSDVNGVMVMELWPNPGTDELAGSYNPYAIINGFRLTPVNVSPIATNPVPRIGSTVDTTQPDFQWEPGMNAVSHDVYLGTVRDDVENATRDNQLGVLVEQGIGPNSYDPGILQSDTTYYWRIDEVKGSTIEKGNVWNFYIPPMTAYNPSPVNGVLFADANFLDPAVILDWYQAADATSYHVYFGDDLDAVQAGTGATDKGTVTDPNYDLASMLELNKTYYWRIDASDGTTTYPGDIWSFKTSPADLGTITKDIWLNVNSGNDLNVLKNDNRYPDNPTVTQTLTSFDTGPDGYDQANYGGQISGWLYVPLTGNYTFWLGTAGQGELWLSTDEDPENLMPQYIDYEPVWGNLGAYAFSHSSDPIPLTGGKKYYIEALWVSVDWDYCQVAWEGAGIRDQQIIRGCYLSPFAPIEAYGPNPKDNSVDVRVDPVLKWKAGKYAASHVVSLGTDSNALSQVGTRQLGDENYIHSSQLLFNQTYYWRIDEVNDLEPNSPWIGKTWSFATGNYLVLEDFEDYNDYPPDEVWNVWLDGYDDPLNGSTAGYGDPDFVAGEHYLEDMNVHGGQWSMPLFYDNSTAPISEVTRTFTSALSNWNRDDVVTLTLFFCGDPNNIAEPMFVAVDDAVVTHGDPDAALITEWTRWDIPLQLFADQGVNLSNVGSMTIGFGNKSNPTAGGGAGHVFFDDIRLYRQE